MESNRTCPLKEYNSDTYALWLAYSYRDTEPETIDISFLQKLAGVPDYSKNKRFEAYNRVFEKLGKDRGTTRPHSAKKSEVVSEH